MASIANNNRQTQTIIKSHEPNGLDCMSRNKHFCIHFFYYSDDAKPRDLDWREKCEI